MNERHLQLVESNSGGAEDDAVNFEQVEEPEKETYNEDTIQGQLSRTQPAYETLVKEGRKQGLRWEEMSRCQAFDTEMFFPEKGGSSRLAKLVCAACDVRVECLNNAMRRDERYGVAGGMSERERRRLKKLAAS